MVSYYYYLFDKEGNYVAVWRTARISNMSVSNSPCVWRIERCVRLYFSFGISISLINPDKYVGGGNSNSSRISNEFVIQSTLNGAQRPNHWRIFFGIPEILYALHEWSDRIIILMFSFFTWQTILPKSKTIYSLTSCQISQKITRRHQNLKRCIFDVAEHTGIVGLLCVSKSHPKPKTQRMRTSGFR